MANPFDHASNGYLRLKGAVVANITKVDYDATGNVGIVVTTTGKVGFARPSARLASVQCENAVPIADLERKAIRRSFEASEVFEVVYHSAGSQYSMFGVIEDWRVGTVANREDSFSFSIKGADGDAT